jgi:homocysteine S-methyltransferase
VARVSELLARRGLLILDGGLATELEERGHDLSHALWSARVLATDPAAIEQVHRDFYLAGADVATAATYQASFAGFAAAGYSREEARGFLQLAVDLALRARASLPNAAELAVAASVGPFGAARADGSEYHGHYGVDRGELLDFHAERFELLCASGADALACETIPSRVEAEVLCALVAAASGMEAWLACACQNGAELGDGTPIEEVAALAAGVPNLIAFGVNCTAPRHLPELVLRVHAALPGKPIVAYPNSGEAWDAGRRAWSGAREPTDFGAAARLWYARGARLVGGCCRTRPAHIRAIRQALAAPPG